jgi:hypothetical protein
VIEAAQETATRRIVKVSGSATLDGHPLIPGHTEAIEALRASTLDWTVVSPSFAMETALGVQARLLAATGAMCGCTAGGLRPGPRRKAGSGVRSVGRADGVAARGDRQGDLGADAGALAGRTVEHQPAIEGGHPVLQPGESAAR